MDEIHDVHQHTESCAVRPRPQEQKVEVLAVQTQVYVAGQMGKVWVEVSAMEHEMQDELGQSGEFRGGAPSSGVATAPEAVLRMGENVVSVEVRGVLVHGTQLQ